MTDDFAETMARHWLETLARHDSSEVRFDDLPEQARVEMVALTRVLLREMDGSGLYMCTEGEGVVDGRVVKIRVRPIDVPVEAEVR